MKFLEESETIFKDESVLDYDFLPEQIRGRENEINEISLCIKPLFHSKKPSNLFIFGKHGIGKTTCVRHVLSQVKKTNVTPIKINCWENSSSFSILQKIAISLGIPIPRKGVSKDDLVQTLKNNISQVRGLVVVLDEVDKLEDEDILYHLSEFFGNKICIILITNHREFILGLEERIKSRLGLVHLSFEPYSDETVYKILEERVEYAFIPNALSEKVLQKISNICYEKEDIRTGLFLLLHSGRNAEYGGRLIVKTEDIEKASKKLATSFSLGKEKVLNDEERFILQCIKENNGKTSGEIFSFYTKNGGKMVERTYRKYINHLLQLNLIDSVEKRDGKRGARRVLSLKC